MRVLIACEFSGIVRDAFAKQGHDAWSCDLEPTELEGNHIIGDVIPILEYGWDLLIAHPPCTYLANSSNRWLYEEEGRWEKMRAGAEFFLKMLNAPIEKIAVENPRIHGHALEIIGRECDQVIEPRYFGHGVSKATCLWLKNLKGLHATNVISRLLVKDTIHREPPGPNRQKNRSRTFQGIADAMAEQWG